MVGKDRAGLFDAVRQSAKLEYLAQGLDAVAQKGFVSDFQVLSGVIFSSLSRSQGRLPFSCGALYTITSESNVLPRCNHGSRHVSAVSYDVNESSAGQETVNVANEFGITRMLV